ncbi:MAG: hypothetical protein D6705_00215 [Deltaproteobacteria bacterium]|nr:MAG: hypothetical protein D6705_00215 [Deltaproteobacteria bacterium]
MPRYNRFILLRSPRHGLGFAVVPSFLFLACFSAPPSPGSGDSDATDGSGGTGGTSPGTSVGGTSLGTSSAGTSSAGTSSTGTSSTGGMCSPDLPDLCDGECVDLQTDPNHCGDCATVCGPGASCIAGTCDMPAVVEVDSDSATTCSLWNDGSVRCWGRNTMGQLGQAHTDNIGDNETPDAGQDTELGEPALQIDLGEEFACALLASGDIRCWGKNDVGQLGHGAANPYVGDDEPPASMPTVQGLGEPAVQVTAGFDHACALLASGSVRCWGGNANGQLGYGHTMNVGKTISVDDGTLAGDVDTGLPDVAEIHAGYRFTCARSSSGQVRCWGKNDVGQLGLGHTQTIGDDEVPADSMDTPVGGNAQALTVGDTYACVLLEGGDVRCWGRNSGGKLGLGNTNDVGDDELPSDVPTVSLSRQGADVQIIRAGSEHTCVVFTDGGLQCWGVNWEGQLGLGYVNHIGDDELPSSVGRTMVGEAVLATGGGYSRCVVLANGGVRCWGNNNTGQLGYGDTDNRGATAATIPSKLPNIKIK